MKHGLIIVFIFWWAFFFGAIMHEADMSNNFKTHGDARAWFFPIVAEK